MRSLSLAIASAALLAGCSGLLGHVNHDADQDARTSLDIMRKASDDESNRVAALQPVTVNDGMWVSARTMKRTHSDVLPAVFSQPASFDRVIASLPEFAEQITRLTQIRTNVAANALQASARAQQQGALTGSIASPPAMMNSAGTPLKPPLPSRNAMANNAGMGAAGTAGAVFVPVRMMYAGGGLLDAASARFGVFWKYSEGAIDFFYTDTRTFQVSAIPGDSTVNAAVVSGAINDPISTTSGTTGNTPSNSVLTTSGLSFNNSANTVVNSQLSVFDGLQNSIQSMLSPYGSSVASPATGSISVTDTPDVLERVAAFMAQQNRALSRQVMLNVTVLSVTLSAQDSYGIDWSAVYQTLSKKFSLSNTFISTATNPVSFAASVLSPTSNLNGTTMMIQALSTQGRVRRKTSASVTTLNNQPVPVQVATQQGYLASISTTNTANVGSATSLTPGTVTTGFNMTLLPHVLDDGTVMLQFFTNISSLLALQNVSSGGTNPMTIQTPEVDTRNFLQRVAMKSGETLVISGYEGTNDNSNQSGTGTASMYALGGGYDTNRSREVIVILITPVTQGGGA